MELVERVTRSWGDWWEEEGRGGESEGRGGRGGTGVRRRGAGISFTSAAD